MKNLRDRKIWIYLIYIFYAVGVAGHLFGTTLDLMLKMTPYTILFSSLYVFLLTDRSKKFYIWFIITFLFTYLMEVLGVKTGLVFGEYVYGKTLGFKLFEVPLLIGTNWVFVVLGSILLCEKYFKNTFLVAFATGLISFIFDFIMEPVAINYDYWTWSGGSIPLQNYIAWFSIAFLAALLYKLLKVKITSKLPKHFVIVQFIFFSLLNLGISIWG